VLSRKRTRVAAANLQAAFPHEKPETIRTWTREVWSELGAGVWEFARLGVLTPEKFDRDVRVIGGEHLRAAHAEGKRGGSFYGAHWELGIHRLGDRSGGVAHRSDCPAV
jgi:lauroyl/myristoyl acyltransferase